MPCGFLVWNLIGTYISSFRRFVCVILVDEVNGENACPHPMGSPKSGRCGRGEELGWTQIGTVVTEINTFTLRYHALQFPVGQI